MKEIDRELLTQDEKICHPVIVSHITNKAYQYAPLKNLEQILSEESVKRGGA
jgi:hypothetical protein